MLTLSGVTHVYANGTRALEDATLAIDNGMFGLLGPNGAGKSTLMRCIATLQTPSAGSIVFGDIDVIKEPERLRAKLGYLPQDFGVYPRVSAYELLDHLAVLKGIGAAGPRKDTVETLLNQVNLWAVRKKAVAGFSGGMRQRFGIAQALIGGPELIIVDEPTAGLDPEERNRFSNLLAEIGQNVVVILSTHIVDDVADLCSRMAIINEGAAAAIAPTRKGRARRARKRRQRSSLRAHALRDVLNSRARRAPADTPFSAFIRAGRQPGCKMDVPSATGAVLADAGAKYIPLLRARIPMDGNINLARARDGANFVARAALALNRQRLAAVALVMLLLSLRALVSPALLDFFSPTEIAVAWMEHLAELAVIGATLLAAFAVLDEALPRGMPLRLAVMSVLLLVLSAVLAVLLHAYYAGGFEHLPPPLRMLADSLGWGLPAVFLALIADVHQRALQINSAAHAAEVARAQLEQGESEQQLALLQAQIEPHFLFNILGNVRRLYRTQPQAGAEAVGSLMHYLRTALPQLRNRRASLGEEISLVRSYLDLYQLRMGAQLGYSIEIDTALQDAEFPPMLLVTLAENAIKHGLEPAGGGHIEVRARTRRNLLEVTVLDNGAGFGGTASSGTGVGLVNVRRQLVARYQNRARLILEGREPRGARATIAIPLRSARADDPVARVAFPA